MWFQGIALMIACGLQAAAADIAAPLACTSEPPIVDAGANVSLRAWTLESNSPNIAWKSESGERLGDGAKIELRVPRDSESRTILAEMKSSDGTISTCKVILIVNLPERDYRTNGYAFLKAGASEEPGWGLYSYLLLGGQPTADALPLYTAVAEGYFASVPPLASLQRFVRDKKLAKPRANAAWIPTRVDPDSRISNTGAREQAAWLLKDQHYDYARSSIYLNLFSPPPRNGIYVVSVLKPLMREKSLQKPYLIIDLTQLPTDMARPWVVHFFNLTAQERFWDDHLTLDTLMLKARTVLGAMAPDVDEVRKGLENWIKVFK